MRVHYIIVSVILMLVGCGNETATKKSTRSQQQTGQDLTRANLTQESAGQSASPDDGTQILDPFGMGSYSTKLEASGGCHSFWFPGAGANEDPAYAEALQNLNNSMNYKKDKWRQGCFAKSNGSMIAEPSCEETQPRCRLTTLFNKLTPDTWDFFWSCKAVVRCTCTILSLDAGTGEIENPDVIGVDGNVDPGPANAAAYPTDAAAYPTDAASPEGSAMYEMNMGL